MTQLLAQLRMTRRIVTAIVMLAAFLVPSALFAQACPLCYQSAASSSAKFIEALKSGIIVLILPCILICSCVSVAAYRRRNACDEDEVSRSE